MKKILRLHENGTQNIEGWQRSVQINEQHIDDIPDPSGGRAVKVGTSIPTPYARMYLFKTAFEFVNESKHLKDDTVYHRIVSECLDILEILFRAAEYRRSGKNLTIRPWNVDTKLQELLSSENETHRLLGNTLSLFLDAKNSKSPFHEFSTFYLVYYNHEIIGGSSPFTLFFTPPGLKPSDLVSSKGYHFFENQKPKALTERPLDFQMYLYKLFLAYPELDAPQHGRAMSNYLNELAWTETDSSIRNKVKELRAQQNYQLINFAEEYAQLLDDHHAPVMVKNFAIRCFAHQQTVESDFEIRPTLPLQGQDRLPLVLPRGGNFVGWQYVAGPWDADIEVPLRDPVEVLENRKLPKVGLQYPYLTIGDFLSDYLIALPYELNTDGFYTGQIEYYGNAKEELALKFPYLLPIKKRFFDYFSFHDLQQLLKYTIVDSQHVKIQLTVPVKRGIITYEREYYANPINPQKDGKTIREKGKIMEAHIGVVIFPNYKFKDLIQYNDFYKLMLVDLDISGTYAYQSYDVDFFLDNKRIESGGGNFETIKTERVQKQESTHTIGSTYYEVRGTHFAFAEIIHPEAKLAGEDVSGLIIPKWKEITNGNKEFSFAVDFGTTNTHIAYTDASNNPPQPFTIEEEDIQLLSLAQPKKDHSLKPGQRYGEKLFEQHVEIYKKLEREFVPFIIGKDLGSPFQFPIRTTVCEVSDFGKNGANLFGNINIGFGINTETSIPSDTVYNSNLKWSNELDPYSEERVNSFFTELLLLIKNKVALNQGDIRKMSLTWFYPLSLNQFAQNMFSEKWTKLFKEIFHTEETSHALYNITESVAPYYYWRKSGKVVPNQTEVLLNIDIGGGSTDLLFFVEQQPQYGTSFRFAGNHLWGDGFADISQKDNGFLLALSNYIERLPPSENVRRLTQYLDEAQKKNEFRSEDIMNLLFSHNEYEKGKTLTQALAKMSYLRILLMIHYAAIVYHSGQLLKYLNIKVPRYITFSGRGSLYINILAGGRDPSNVKHLSEIILKKVCDHEPPSNFELLQSEKPKEATANGGVYLRENNSFRNVKTATVKLLGVDASQEIEHDKISYNQYDEEIKKNVLQNAQDLLQFIFEDAAVLKCIENFGIEADFEVLKEKMLTPPSLLGDSFDRGWAKMKSMNKSEHHLLSETLFFLPFIHTLYELSKELYQDYYQR